VGIASQALSQPGVVSVIVPAYNAERTLPDCLGALAGQAPAGPDVEVVVVDDGSTDGTADAAARYPDVTVVRQAQQGPAAARNAGARKAAGEILLFTDADCVPEHDWVAQMTAAFSDPSVAAVKGAYRTRQQSLVARFAQVEFEERYALLERRPSIDFVDTYSAAFRTRDFWEAGGFDPAFPYPNNEDVDLSYRLARTGRRMVFNPRAIVYHRHAETLRRYLRTKFGRGYWRTVVYRRFPGKAVADSYTPQILKVQIVLVFLLAGSLVAMPFVRHAGSVLGVAGLGFLASTAAFVHRAWRTGWVVGTAAVPLLALRAGALGSGVAWALAWGAWRFPASTAGGQIGPPHSPSARLRGSP